MHNVEAEAALLGAMMIDNRIVDTVRTFLRPGDFHEYIHERVYTKILQFRDKERVANPVTLRPAFALDPSMQSLGGPGYLAQLTGNSAALVGARDFAEQVHELSVLRQMDEAAVKLRSRLNDTSEETDVPAALAEFEMTVAAIDAVGNTVPTRSIDELWGDVEDDVDDLAAGKEAAGFLINQYTDANAVIGRMDAGDYIILGGRPSMGKTAVAVAIALGAADAGHGVDLLSLEMVGKRIARRAVAQIIYREGRSPTYAQLSDGKMTPAQRDLVRQGRKRIEEYPLTISDPDEMFIEDLDAHIKRMKRRFARKGVPLRLLIIDYLGKLKSRGKYFNANDRVTFISEMIKACAKKNGIAIIALAQLGRAVEQREDKRPLLSDLRDSGSLEQDADVVCYVYRDEYYRQREKPPANNVAKMEAWHLEMEACRDRLEFYSAKKREGPLIKKTGWFKLDAQAVRPESWNYGEDLFAQKTEDLPF